METVSKILDIKLKNNDKYIGNHILSFLQSKCHECKQTVFIDDCIKVFHTENECCDRNTHVYRCYRCSCQHPYNRCVDMCLQCEYINHEAEIYS